MVGVELQSHVLRMLHRSGCSLTRPPYPQVESASPPVAAELGGVHVAGEVHRDERRSPGVIDNGLVDGTVEPSRRDLRKDLQSRIRG